MDPNQQFQPPPPPTIEAEPERARPTHLTFVGIALFVLGIVVVVLGIPKLVGVINGGIGTGGVLCIVGILLFGLSFLRYPHVKDAPPKMSLPAMLSGIFFEPTAVFRNLRAHPRWITAALIIGVLNGAYIAAFTHRLTPERIVNYTADKMAETPFIPPEAVERARTDGVVQAKSATFQVGAFVQKVCTAILYVAALGALYLLGVLIFGGTMHYWQAISVAAYSSLPFVFLQKLISMIVLYLKSPDDIHPLIGQESLAYDNLGYLISSKDHPVLWAVAAAIGVLSFYKLWLSAKGIGEGGTKVGSSTGWAVSITIWLLGLLLGVILAALFGSFLG